MAIKKSFSRFSILVGALLLLAPPLLYLILAGWVEGEEFSPGDFSRRRFSYNVMPIFKIHLRGIEYHDSTPVFEQTLYADGLIGKAPVNPQWHLKSDSVSDQDSADFDARFLCQMLDITEPDNSSSIWVKWNQENPQLASFLWPIIADLARESLYLSSPEILVRAIDIQPQDKAEFRNYVIRTASAQFLKKADILNADRKFDDAVALYSKSIELRPSRSALKGRASCYRQLDQSALGDRDLSAAAALEPDQK